MIDEMRDKFGEAVYPSVEWMPTEEGNPMRLLRMPMAWF